MAAEGKSLVTQPAVAQGQPRVMDLLSALEESLSETKGARRAEPVGKRHDNGSREMNGHGHDKKPRARAGRWKDA